MQRALPSYCVAEAALLCGPHAGCALLCLAGYCPADIATLTAAVQGEVPPGQTRRVPTGHLQDKVMDECALHWDCMPGTAN